MGSRSGVSHTLMGQPPLPVVACTNALHVHQAYCVQPRQLPGHPGPMLIACSPEFSRLMDAGQPPDTALQWRTLVDSNRPEGPACYLPASSPPFPHPHVPVHVHPPPPPTPCGCLPACRCPPCPPPTHMYTRSTSGLSSRSTLMLMKCLRGRRPRVEWERREEPVRSLDPAGP